MPPLWSRPHLCFDLIILSLWMLSTTTQIIISCKWSIHNVNWCKPIRTCYAEIMYETNSITTLIGVTITTCLIKKWMIYFEYNMPLWMRWWSNVSYWKADDLLWMEYVTLNGVTIQYVSLKGGWTILNITCHFKWGEYYSMCPLKR